MKRSETKTTNEKEKKKVGDGYLSGSGFGIWNRPAKSLRLNTIFSEPSINSERNFPKNLRKKKQLVKKIEEKSTKNKQEITAFS